MKDSKIISFDKLNSLKFANAFSTRAFAPVYWRKETGGDERWGSLKEARKNVDFLAKELGFEKGASCVVETVQKHTGNVAVVTKADCGKILDKVEFDNFDGLVTNEKGILLSVNVADCGAVYLVDPVTNSIGLVHSGRKGTFYKIAPNAISLMNEKYGTNALDVTAVIAPMICSDCYEVGQEIYDEFLNSSEWGSEKCQLIFTKKADKWHLNLPLAIKLSLMDCGVLEKNIEISEFCTCCKSDVFYSYRAKKMESENRALLGIK